MAGYRINGYDLSLAFGFVPDADKTSADSFDKSPDMVDVFTHTWDDGVVEYDLNAPVSYKPRTFTLKGLIVIYGMANYNLTRMAISDIVNQNYVTLEQVDTGEKVNAKLKPGANWHRLNNNNSEKIIVEVQYQFDEVMQAAPYKQAGTSDIVYLVDNQGNFITTPQKNNIILK